MSTFSSSYFGTHILPWNRCDNSEDSVGYLNTYHFIARRSEKQGNSFYVIQQRSWTILDALDVVQGGHDTWNDSLSEKCS